MTDLAERLRAEATQSVPAEVAQLALTVAARHPGARAVVYYGSTLRTGGLIGEMLDFYLIVDSYRPAYRTRSMAAANRLLPPNVFPIAADGLLAKYAVLDWRDLKRLTRADAATVSVWARFCQPVRIAWSASPVAVERVVGALERSVLTMLHCALPMADTGDPLALWRTGLTLTYAAELRAERGGRADLVVDAAPERYRALALDGGRALGWTVRDGFIQAQGAGRAQEGRRWARRRRAGKALTLLRLAKASVTFGGGIDYLASKIERHSGTPVRLRPWQRRLPLLGALWLLPSLIRAGAVR